MHGLLMTNAFSGEAPSRFWATFVFGCDPDTGVAAEKFLCCRLDTYISKTRCHVDLRLVSIAPCEVTPGEAVVDCLTAMLYWEPAVSPVMS